VTPWLADTYLFLLRLSLPSLPPHLSSSSLSPSSGSYLPHAFALPLSQPALLSLFLTQPASYSLSLPDGSSMLASSSASSDGK
jgi:hypothetical protein